MLSRSAHNRREFGLPVRLRRIPERRTKVLRACWFLLFSFAVIVDMAAVAYTIRDVHEFRPAFARIGLEYQFGSSGDVLVGTVPDARGLQAVDLSTHVVAVGGQPVPSNARVGEIARRIEEAPGSTVAVDLKKPNGSIVHLKQARTKPVTTASADRRRDVRLAVITGAGLFACGVLLLCSFLLVRRRPSDPVALLFGFAFALMAATVDPALRLWMGLGYADILDVLAGTWIYLLILGLAAFPDGLFIPRQFRWLIVAGLTFPLLYALVPHVSEDIPDILAPVAMLTVIIGQFFRFKRIGAGIERQQIKWTAFGFGTGLFLILVSQVVNVFFIPLDPAKQNLLVNIVMLLCFSFGVAAIPLGLLVALTRYRLWQADAVISRSVAYAVVTLFVGMVWAASSDLVKFIISEVMGQRNGAVATTTGAIVAAVIFAPTQSLVLDWTRRRFGGSDKQIGRAAERLKIWALTETPKQVAGRAIGIIENAVRPSAAAIVLDEGGAAEVIAATNVRAADDPVLTETFTITDEEGPVGRLLLGRKPRGESYRQNDIDLIGGLIPALAEALRAAHGRHSSERRMQEKLEEMAARLAQLEGTTPKPA